MSFATVNSRTLCGISAQNVTVETHLANGLPNFTIVGLPETAVRESKDRVKSALAACQFELPVKRITVNLAPADLPKQGSHFDLAIALSILAAAGYIKAEQLAGYEFLGELSLSGNLRLTRKIIAIALASNTPKNLIVPTMRAIYTNTNVLEASTLTDVVSHLIGKHRLESHSHQTPPQTQTLKEIASVHGQSHAKHALTIAASGGHSLLFTGPPGTGKTLLASHLPSLLPPLTAEEAQQNAILRLLHHGESYQKTYWQRPFRAPHHSASQAALVGGGNPPRPGEISLAHHGVLFLDELPEFSKQAINSLRQPLESNNITIARAANSVDFPAKFQLIAAMNPCPCGYYNDAEQDCRCSPSQIQNYHAKISGPVYDRIDLVVQVSRIKPQLTLENTYSNNETTKALREKILKARDKQLSRQKKLNAELESYELKTRLNLNKNAEKKLTQITQQLKLSLRSYYRLLKVARTIADLRDKNDVNEEILLQAASYRLKF